MYADTPVKIYVQQFETIQMNCYLVSSVFNLSFEKFYEQKIYRKKTSIILYKATTTPWLIISLLFPSADIHIPITVKMKVSYKDVYNML